jgi:ketosteroid isomerase-like protein
MESLRARLDRFIGLVESGQNLEAMQAFYAEDILVFENRDLSRAGRDACIAFERAQLALRPEPPRLRCIKSAVDAKTGVCFIEWVVRFQSSSGRPMRLEEVAVQKWSEAGITEERFYYDGFVDEGDEGDEEFEGAEADQA